MPGFAAKALNDSKPAKGTPIKLTKSLPAKAIASANVPTNTTNLGISSLNNCVKICKIINHPIKLIDNIKNKFSFK